MKEHLQNYKHLIDILENLSKNVPKGDMTTRSTVVQSNATEEDQTPTSRLQEKIDFEVINNPPRKFTVVEYPNTKAQVAGKPWHWRKLFCTQVSYFLLFALKIN